MQKWFSNKATWPILRYFLSSPTLISSGGFILIQWVTLNHHMWEWAESVWFQLISVWFQLIPVWFHLISSDFSWFQCDSRFPFCEITLQCDSRFTFCEITLQCDFRFPFCEITLQCDSRFPFCEITLNHTESHWITLNHPESPWITLNHTESHWNHPESHWNHAESDWMIQGFNPCIKRKSHRKLVRFFLNHWNQQVGRCVLLNHHEWRECNDRNDQLKQLNHKGWQLDH